MKRAALVPLAGALLLLVGLGGVGAETYRLAWSCPTSGLVHSVSISPDGSYIAAGSGDGKVYLFSRFSGTPLWSYQTGGGVRSVISSDGSYIAAGSGDGKVYLFSRSSAIPLWSYQTGAEVWSVSISSDGSYVAAGSWDNRVYLFSGSSSTPLWSYQTGGGVLSVSISSDGSYVAAGSYDYTVYLFSGFSSTPLWSYQTGGRVSSVSISPDGSYIAAGSGDRVYLLSSATARFEPVLFFFKPDGTPLAYTVIYYGMSEGQETALLGTTDDVGRIILTDPALRSTTLYFRSGDGKYRGSYYIPSGGGTLSVQLTGVPGRGLLPLVLILAVIGGAAVAGTVAWRRGLLRRPAGAKPPGKPTGSFCPHCKLRLPPDAQFCPECGRKVRAE